MTKLALEDYPEERRNRIIVAAFAPGAYIDPATCHSVTHYVSPKDLVPKLDREGRRKYRDTIVTLPKHPNVDFFDHSFDSPTYETAIRREIEKYVDKIKGL